MKELEARHELDPAITKVLLDSKGVNVKKISDLCMRSPMRLLASLIERRWVRSAKCAKPASRS